MKRSKFDPLCHKLLTHYVKVIYTNGKHITGHLRPFNDDPIQADFGNFQVGPLRIFASTTKEIIDLEVRDD